MQKQRFEVVQFTPDGRRIGSVAGMGRNAGTWDTGHSRSSAYRHAKQCRADDPRHVYRVEEI